MTSATNEPLPESSTDSVGVSWQHAQELWKSDSATDAWQSLKSVVRTLPGWALALLVVATFGILANSGIILIPLAAGGFLAATYFTVKQAIRSALREHDSESAP